LSGLAGVVNPSVSQLPLARVMKFCPPELENDTWYCVPISAIVPTSMLMRAVSTAFCAVGISCWTAARVSCVAVTPGHDRIAGAPEDEHRHLLVETGLDLPFLEERQDDVHTERLLAEEHLYR